MATEGTGARVSLIDRTIREKIVLVGVTLPPDTDEDTEAGLDELSLLVDTAGADEVARIVQRRAAPDPPTYIGKGKAEELRELALAADCDTVVFDNELTPAQQRNLEKLLGRTAIDRTAVILDIFAQNAHSQEGKAQVELALLRYRLPRLRGKGTSLSQQGGGARRRRPDRHPRSGRDAARGRPPPDPAPHPQARGASCASIAKHRATQRKARTARGSHRVAIVGYTNAGKSTLLNRLTDAGVLVEDRLFATLDPTTRRLDLPGGEPVLLTDTVGFIRKLPHQLVEAFKSTLSEVGATPTSSSTWSTASAPDPEGQIDAVRDGARRDRRRRRAGAARVQQGRPRARATPAGWPRRTRARWPSAPPPARASRSSCSRIGDRLRALTERRRAGRPLRPRRHARRGAPRGRGAVEQADDDGHAASGCGSTSAVARPVRRVRGGR